MLINIPQLIKCSNLEIPDTLINDSIYDFDCFRLYVHVSVRVNNIISFCDSLTRCGPA